MDETLTPGTPRRRVTIARIMAWIAAFGLVLGFVISKMKFWPLPVALGGEINLVILLGMLEIPILPALLIWQVKIVRNPGERPGLAIILLVLCYLAWLGALALTFQALFKATGLS